MNEPLLPERRSLSRLFLLALSLLLLFTAWMFRSSWTPQLLDSLVPILKPMASWHQAWRLPGLGNNVSESELIRLQAENQLLSRQLAALKLVAEENESLRELLEVPLPQGFSQVGAQVILRPPHQWYESLTVDRGFEAGIRVNQVVMGPQGVLGKVSEVTAQTATIQLISHPESTVACIVGKQKVPGVLIGQYRQEPAQLQYLQNYARIRTGDEVLTSGLGGVYPPHLSLGRVAEVRQLPSKPVPEASVTLSPLETHLSHVIVLVPES